jgi:hypothetical protein
MLQSGMRTSASVLLLFSAACGGDGAGGAPDARPAAVSVSVRAEQARLLVGTMTGLTATVANAGDTRVSWSVEEGTAGGSVDTAGRYTAPAAPGTFHVVATSVADPAASGRVALEILPRGSAPLLARDAEAFAGAPTRFSSPDHAVGDFDGDGRPDVAVFNSNASWGPQPEPAGGEVRLFRNLGGTFADATAAMLDGPSPVPENTAANVLARDFDADGRADLYAGMGGIDAWPFTGGSNVFLGTAGGRLRDVSPAAFVPQERKFTHNLAAGDVDGDGDLDVFEANITADNAETGTAYADGEPQLRINDGHGRFTKDLSRLPAAFYESRVTVTAAALCDLRGTGKPDLVLGGWAGGPDHLLLNDGAGRFTAAPAASLPARILPLADSATIFFTCADLDGDGHRDLFVSTYTNDFATGQLAVWLGDGGGAVRDATQAALGAAGRLERGWIRKTFAGDLNGDGLLDLVASGFGAEGGPCPAAIFLNQGEARFTRVDLPVDGCEFFVPIDADGDGRLDLAGLAHGRDRRPSLLRNRGF